MAGLRSFVSLLPFLLLGTAFPREHPDASGLDTQQVCVAPVRAFVDELESGLSEEVRRDTFLGLVRACREVSVHELTQIERHYPQLPGDSHCRELGKEFRETLDMLERIERTAAELPLVSEEDRLAARAFYRLTAPSLSRTVKGIFILHYGICHEETREMPPTRSSNATISIPDPDRSPL
ncbi:hypothetical protein [Pseudomonas sp.]|uniref:hypothetical protein n=1 Tax=Pseudomonas sp. TaxID=306 RepID=UPI002729FA12|nr:hypothetical protein [Pseudomonas sp.]